MALNGLDKITGKILSEAQAKADKIIAEAQAECDKITAEYAARAEQIRSTLSEEAEKEGMDRVSRVRSAMATAKRNAIMQTKSELIDSVFDGALEGTLRLEKEKYTALLSDLLATAFCEQVESEDLSRSLYGEEESILPARYEVLLNQKDHDRIGNDVIAGVKSKLASKVNAERLAKLVLSEKTVAIDGGLILRYGDVESNCSFSLIFAHLRESLQAEVAAALFDVKAPLI